MGQQQREWAKNLSAEQQRYYDEVVVYLKTNHFCKERDSERHLAGLRRHLFMNGTVPTEPPHEWGRAIGEQLPAVTKRQQWSSNVMFALCWLMATPAASLLMNAEKTIADVYTFPLLIAAIIVLSTPLTWRVFRAIFVQESSTHIAVASLYLFSFFSAFLHKIVANFIPLLPATPVPFALNIPLALIQGGILLAILKIER